MSEYIEKIYSKVEPDLLLHQIIRRKAFYDANFRINICDNEDTLQLALLNLKKNQTFKPHKHIYKTYSTDKHLPGESWIVLSGIVKFYMYDIDDKILSETVLNTGDITYTRRGGHTYEALVDNTYIIEVKAGPYMGVEKDKEFIKDEREITTKII